jgi:aspartate racemase
VVSDPRVPDRVGPILDGQGESPLPAMLAGLHALGRAGAECVVVPCHTAHHWHAELAAATPLPILHVVDAVLAELVRRGTPKGPVGLLATAATLEAGLYQGRLGAAGHPCLEPDAEVMAAAVLPAIALVKRDRAAEAAPLLLEAARHLVDRGATTVLLACTELPVALAAAAKDDRELTAACLDATDALARACLAWYRDHHHERDGTAQPPG